MKKEDVLKSLLENAKSLTASITVGNAFRKDVSIVVTAYEGLNKQIVELAKTLPE